MAWLIKIFSYLFHPLFMPLAGVLLYFNITPKFIPRPFLYAKLMAVVILTVIVPVLFYFMLRNLGKIDSIFVEDVRQRRIPLFFQIVLTVLIVSVVLKGYEFPELYYFFIGILITACIAFIGALLKFKISLHMIGLGGVLAFLIVLSNYYESNLLTLIAALIAISGIVASSRLQSKAHTMTEVSLGFALGVLSQIGVFYFGL